MRLGFTVQRYDMFLIFCFHKLRRYFHFLPKTFIPIARDYLALFFKNLYVSSTNSESCKQCVYCSLFLKKLLGAGGVEIAEMCGVHDMHMRAKGALGAKEV